MYIVGRVSDHEIVERSGRYSPNDPPDAIILENLIARIGGAVEDYTITHIGNDGEIVERLSNGDAHDVEWTGDEITGFDFALEDAKRIITIELVDPADEGTSKTEIVANDSDAVRIKVKANLPDMSGVDSSFNETLNVPIFSPSKNTALIQFVLTDGEGYKDFKTVVSGAWRFSSKYDFAGKNAKIVNSSEEITALMDL